MEKKVIESIASKYIPNFVGVYDINVIPKPNSYTKNSPASYIVNTLHSTSSLTIGHWVAIIVEPDKITILDTIGKYALKDACLQRFVKKNWATFTNKSLPYPIKKIMAMWCILFNLPLP